MGAGAAFHHHAWMLMNVLLDQIVMSMHPVSIQTDPMFAPAFHLTQEMVKNAQNQ